MTSSTGRAGEASGGFAVAEAAGAFWSALVEDAACAVGVVDAEGQVHYLNGEMSRLTNLDGAGDAGRTIFDLWGESFARERLDMIREAAATGRTLTIEGMMRGRWVRCVLRPLTPDVHHRRRVLMVCRVTSPTRDAENGQVRRARIDDRGSLAALTDREFEILRLIGSGKSTAQIAKQLHRSVKTVEWHRVSLGNKLGVANRVELARIAIGAGLIDPDETVDE